MNPDLVGHNGLFSPLKEKNVRHHIRPGVGLKGVVGQADGAQQLSSLSEVPAHGGVFGIHGVARSHEGHQAAGTHLIQCLGKEVVVDGEAQLVICLVVDLILAEGDVADSQIVEVPPVSGLKSGHSNVCLGVELLGNASADGVQLYAI